MTLLANLPDDKLSKIMDCLELVRFEPGTVSVSSHNHFTVSCMVIRIFFVFVFVNRGATCASVFWTKQWSLALRL